MKYTEQILYRVPQNVPIWALAYDINNETEHRNFICKPVQGEIIDRMFYPYKKGTTERRMSGKVHYWARKYADTYEEAVELYNELVQERIETLYKLIGSAQLDMIPVNTTEGDT